MNQYEQWRLQAARRGRPAAAHLELTYRCNARCPHCYQDHDSRLAEPTTQQWLDLVDQLRAGGVLVVTLSGGEAMLSPHFWPLAQRVREQSMALRVYTNGLLLNRSTCARLATLTPASVDISLFSLRPEVHDRVTGVQGSLRHAVRELMRLHRLGVTTRIKCPLLHVSAPDYRQVQALAKRLGNHVTFDPTITPCWDGGGNPVACRADDATLVAYFQDPESHAVKTLEPRAPHRDICGIARWFTVVAADGSVLPCTHVRQSAGNIKDTPWAEIWEQSPLLQRLRTTTFGDLRTCAHCPRSGYCARCGAVAMLEDGDFLGPSSRACHLAELKEQALGFTPPVEPPLPAPRKTTNKRLRCFPG